MGGWEIDYYVDEFITELTGITNEMLDDAPEAYEVLSAFVKFIGDDLLIGHNERTCKSEVEEYYKTELVTNIEEVVVGIIAATPYSYSVEVSEYASLK